MPIRLSAPVRATLFVALLAVLALPAQAQWRWRDKAGHVTASDLPPPRDIPDKDILQRPDAARRAAAAGPAAPASAASAALTAAAPADPELETRRRAAEQQKQAKAKADDERLAAQRAENCRRARSAVTTFESGQRIARTNDRGEREFLDDRARADELRRAQDIVASDCR